MMPNTYKFIWQVGWNAGHATGDRLAKETAEDNLARFELTGLQNQEFQLGYRHASRVALGEINMTDVEELNEKEKNG
ncbi:MAG: hypothetical protein WDZ94_01755 [Patescibacteria group bacterium]